VHPGPPAPLDADDVAAGGASVAGAVAVAEVRQSLRH